MRKQIIILAILALLTSCRQSPVPAPTPVVEPIPSASPISSSTEDSSSATPRVKLTPDPYYTTPEERTLIIKAEAKMNEVLHSPCYHSFMANRKMIQTNGKTPKQVADEFTHASGEIPVQFYYSRFTSTRAYRQPPSNVIHINRKYISPDSDLCEVAGTFAHESVGHSLLNYEHDMQWSASREFSAPYSSDHAFAAEPYSMSDSGNCCH